MSGSIGSHPGCRDWAPTQHSAVVRPSTPRARVRKRLLGKLVRNPEMVTLFTAVGFVGLAAAQR